MAHQLRDELIHSVSGCELQELRIEALESGKPEIAYPPGWHMNLSHSRELAAVALARHTVGVDVEYLNRAANWAGIAERAFHADELRQLKRMDDQAFVTAAIKLWTAKEAWLKATGLGIPGFASAPAFRWQGTEWQTGEGAALKQLAVSDNIWLSCYLCDAAEFRLELRCFNAQISADSDAISFLPCAKIAP